MLYPNRQQHAYTHSLTHMHTYTHVYTHLHTHPSTRTRNLSPCEHLGESSHGQLRAKQLRHLVGCWVGLGVEMMAGC